MSGVKSELMQKQRETYLELGYLKVRKALPSQVLQNVIDDIEREVDRRAYELFEAGEITDLCRDDPFAARWYNVWRQMGREQGSFGWHACTFGLAMYQLWIHPAILDAVESLIGPELQFNGDFWVRPKLPAEGITTIPWHQDSAYIPETEKAHLLTLWLPLVPVDANNGALQFLPGTHHLEIQKHDDRKAGALPTTSFDPAEGREVVTLDMEPGDFVLFNNRTFHRSTVNQASSVRWSIDFRYSEVGTSMDHLWHGDMCFTVRSSRQPDSVPGWDRVAAQWQKSSQRVNHP